MAYVSTPTIYTSGELSDRQTQTGDFYVYDLTNPALPKLDAQLVQNFFRQAAQIPRRAPDLTVFNDQTAIVLGTSAFGSTTNGQALWTTIDVSTPAKPNVVVRR